MWHHFSSRSSPLYSIPLLLNTGRLSTSVQQACNLGVFHTSFPGSERSISDRVNPRKATNCRNPFHPAQNTVVSDQVQVKDKDGNPINDGDRVSIKLRGGTREGEVGFQKMKESTPVDSQEQGG